MLRLAPLLLLAALLCSTAASAAPDPLMAAHRGGTLRLTADSAFGSLDPQINYTVGFSQVFYVVYDGLVTFRKTGGPTSDDVVPDLADSVPVPLDGGRTWVFHLRSGIRFSNGQPLTVDDVVATFRRIFRVSSPGSSNFYSSIVGAEACLKQPAGCMLEGGVVADAAAGTVTFHLATPDPEFLQQLAISFAQIVPAGTPDRDVGDDAAPSTGPYMITHYEANRHLRLERNPYFHVWNPDAQPDGYVDAIDYSFGLSDEAEVTAVENNEYDWTYDEKPLDRLGEIGNNYADRTHVSPAADTYFVPMNVNLYPFDHPKAREAVNYAIDRRAIVMFKGGPGAALPLCQNIPRDFPGHVAYCPYTLGADPAHPAQVWRAPDIELAKRLVRESGTFGAHVTLVVPDHAYAIAMGAYLQSMLHRIGYEASLRALDFNVQYTYIQNSNNKVQISMSDQQADYPAASDFLEIFFSCGAFHPGSDSSLNFSGYCNKDLDARMKAADAASVIDRARGNAMWAAIDREVTNLSLQAPLFQNSQVDLVSERLGNYTFSQVAHMLFSKVWVR